MTHHRLVTAVLLSLGCMNASATDADIAHLRWLGGCWQSEGAEPGSVEQWLPLAGGTLFGVSRTVKQGKTVQFEFMQIRAIDGRLAFIATPSGQATATFPVLRIDATEAVFENLQHDFPQRIIYRLAAPDRLLARIEGMNKNALRALDFPMKRVSCDAQVKAASRPQ